ncbi:hypothetical protein PVL29_013828 [Vitis rotundifolia]|uniref:Uncharacterized protein n=1 Tax=Vitis rotundifolia TaxID=103349 RepID=A0AA38ZMG0_VITRO|nr:hypothetical protein PVL29_013828 [Vitis rotundifolia]
MVETGTEQSTFVQGFLAGRGTTMIDLERHLRCLSLKPTLKFVVISLSPFSSQMIWETTGLTLISCSVPMEDESVGESNSVLAAKEVEAKEEAKEEGDGDDRTGVF